MKQSQMTEQFEQLKAEQDEFIKSLGVDPRTVTEEELVVMFVQKTKIHDCAICLDPIESGIVFPCKCLYYKVHKECLPNSVIKCARCGIKYGADIAIKCVAKTLFGYKCKRKRCDNSDFCSQHAKRAARGHLVRLWTST